MDFSNRSIKPQTEAPQAPTSTASTRKTDKSKWSRIGVVAGLATLAILLLASITLAATGGPKPENEYIKSDKLQAVFLNTGQVYFGNIKNLNSKYLTLSNIYYLQTASSGAAATTTANSNVTLVKLGCELHEPYDQMVINRDQVTFWENLQDNGQVATAVTNFKKQNPDGQKCADQSSSASTNSVNNTQNAGSGNPAPTTPNTNTGTTNRTNP